MIRRRTVAADDQGEEAWDNVAGSHRVWDEGGLWLWDDEVVRLLLGSREENTGVESTQDTQCSLYSASALYGSPIF